MNNPIHYDRISCFHCGGTLNRSVYAYTTFLFVDDVKYPIESDLRLCTGCGLILNDPRLSEESLDWLYSTWYGADTALYGSEELARLDQARRSFIEAESGPVKAKKILDVGSGGGSFLATLRSEGADVYGIEPSADLRVSAKNTYGLEIYGGLLDDSFSSTHAEEYDIVTFNEVLEHVYDPMAFLRSVTHVTARYVYFDVPNTLHPRWGNIADFFGIEHLTHFTPASIARIAHTLGLTVVALEEDNGSPIYKVMLEKAPPQNAPATVTDDEISGILNVFNLYRKNREKFLSGLREKVQEHPSVIVYGAGRHTIQMIENHVLSLERVAEIVDSNAQKHGKRFMGRTIQSPEILVNNVHPVVISSFDSQDDISAYLTRTYPDVKQIKFY